MSDEKDSIPFIYEIDQGVRIFYFILTPWIEKHDSIKA